MSHRESDQMAWSTALVDSGYLDGEWGFWGWCLVAHVSSTILDSTRAEKNTTDFPRF
jgi:hypothetical protein